MELKRTYTYEDFAFNIDEGFFKKIFGGGHSKDIPEDFPRVRWQLDKKTMDELIELEGEMERNPIPLKGTKRFVIMKGNTDRRGKGREYKLYLWENMIGQYFLFIIEDRSDIVKRRLTGEDDIKGDIIVGLERIGMQKVGRIIRRDLKTRIPGDFFYREDKWK